MGNRTQDASGHDPADVAWTRWYREAREEAAFRYGLKGIPTDEYKTEWALGSTVQAGVRNIARSRGLAKGSNQ